MDIQFSILEEIEKNGNCMDYVTLLNIIDATPATTDGVLQVMIEEKLISGTLEANSVVKMEPEGTALLLQLRANADKEARQHANQLARDKRDWIAIGISAFALLVSLLTLILK